MTVPTWVGGDADRTGLATPTSLPVTLPTVLDGDVAALVIQSFHNVDRGLPTSGLTGWTLRLNTGSGVYSYRTMIWTRTLTAAESGTNVAPVFSGGNAFSVAVAVARGVDASDPIKFITGQNKADPSTTISWGAMTTTIADCLAVAVMSAKSPVTAGGGFPAPSGWTERLDSSGTDAYRNGALSTKAAPVAGVHTPPNVTIASNGWASVAFAFAPTVGVPPEIGPNPSGFEAFVPELVGEGWDFRMAPSEEHKAVLHGGGVYTMGIELIDALTGGSVWSTMAGRADEADWWPAEPDGPLSFARGRSRQRSLSLSIPIDDIDPRTARLLLRNTGHPLHPVTRNMVRAWAGHVLGARAEMLPLCTLIVDKADLVDNGSILLSISTVDPSSLLDTSFGAGGWRVEDGANAVEEAVRVLEAYLPDMAVILAESTSYTLPAIEKKEGDSVEQFVTAILDAVGMELTVDELGRYRIEQIGRTWASAADPADWRYGDDGGLPVDEVRASFVVPDAPSGVTLKGGSATAEDEAEVTVTVWDQDSSSLTWWDVSNPAPWAYAAEITSELVRTDQQGKVAAWGHFRRVGRGGQRVSFTALPNPALRPDHTVEFGWERLGILPGLWVVESVTLPIEPGQLMLAEIARSWDPAKEDAEIADPNPTPPGAVSASENFNWGVANGFIYDRPNWAGNAGTDTVYTKSNQAWGGNGHGLARWTIPMLSTNHWSELYIFEIRSDSKGVGPHVRQQGTGVDIVGYQAAAVYAGGSRNKIELRRWKSKKDYEVIGTYTHGSNLELDTIRLEADGSTLRVKVNGTLALTVVDTTHTAGTFVGFVISNAGADNWAAGTL